MPPKSINIQGIIADLESSMAELEPQWTEYETMKGQVKMLRRILNPPPKRPRRPSGASSDTNAAADNSAPS